jgi:hypothetical protein
MRYGRFRKYLSNQNIPVFRVWHRYCIPAKHALKPNTSKTAMAIADMCRLLSITRAPGT